jgi:hypothetical protein
MGREAGDAWGETMRDERLALGDATRLRHAHE